jgi:uncharacterized membrane protein YqiK
MGAALILVLLFALVLVGAPIGLNAFHHPLGAAASMVMISTGIVLTIICATLLTITRLYVKTRASEAFVRTGMGGLKVIRDGGALVIPVVHQVVRVSLETIRLDVSRQGPDALITSDKLRADIKAEFFVRVQPDDNSIQAAARSLGDKMTEDAAYNRTNSGNAYQSSVARLIEDKLVSALRSAAARQTLEELNSKRDEFLKEVTQLVKSDLDHNGFTLETVTLSKLDQTSEEHLKANNIFDAQGMRTIAEITQRNLTQRNEIVRGGEQARASQDVDTRKQILELDRAKAEAEASQATQIAIITAEQGRLAKEKQISADQSIAMAQVAQQQMIEIAKREQARDIEIAERSKVEAITVANQRVEVAQRSSLKAVAEADAEKANAEAKLATAEADRQKARQSIITVEQLAEADRAKQKAVIAAEADAEKNYVGAKKAADADAYRTRTEADAKKASADAEAEATRKRADADAGAMKARADGEKVAALAQADANKARLLAEAEGKRASLLAEAEGQRAVAMVPIDVKAREVEIDQSRVENVLKPELEARQKNGQVAQDFELARFRIEKEAEVRIATATATAQFYGKISANVYGTPEDVAKMGANFSRGMGMSQMISGFLEGADAETDAVARRLVDTVEKAGSALVERIKPNTPPNGG